MYEWSGIENTRRDITFSRTKWLHDFVGFMEVNAFEIPLI